MAETRHKKGEADLTYGTGRKAKGRLDIPDDYSIHRESIDGLS